MDPEWEKLLGLKSFEQLSLTEKEYVLDSMTKEEYERFRAFLKSSKASSEKDYNGMNPSPRVRDILKAAYLQRFNKKVTSGFSKENKIFERLVPRTILTYVAITAFIILAAVLFFELSNSDFEHSNTKTTAMDIDQIENFELLQEQMSLKETGIYSKIIVPEIHLEMSLVRSDTLLIP